MDSPPYRPLAPAFSQFPDSPSVYSHAYHSPDVDLDDETASTATGDVQHDSDLDDCADDASHRISLQGPKIRFHSRAPWETDDAASHFAQSDNGPKSATIGNKLKGTASKADNLIRTFTRRSSIASRPSVDSTRSRVSVTPPLEFTAGTYSGSRGALYDLAKQSMSSSSLASNPMSVRSQNFARTASYPKSSHYSTQNHDSSSRGTVSLDGVVSPLIPLGSALILSSSTGDTSGVHVPSTELSQERQSHDQFVHPYANPDLVAYTLSPETIPSQQSILGDMGGSDSNSTITDTTSTRSAALSIISPKTSFTSLTSRDIPHGNLRLNGKEISSPISVLRQNDASYVDRSTRFLSLHPPPAGFDGPLRNNMNPRSPTVALISLQEAQARERFRSSTTHTTATWSQPPFVGSDDIPERMEDQTAEMDTGGKLTHTRARSNSANTRYKTLPLAQDAEMREEEAVSTSLSAVPGRVLKHKKSGFMRLFSSRSSEGEKERSLPPPVFPHVDTHGEEGFQTRAPKHVQPRAPKSPLSATVHGPDPSNVTLVPTHSTSTIGHGPDGKGFSSRRRQPPSLSIVTKTSDHGISIPISGNSSPIGLNFAPSPFSLTVPQSAPAGNSGFPGLKLRPVSTSFSSHFADIVADATEEPQRDVRTPSSTASSNTALSPFTPISTRRSDDASTSVVEAPSEECLTVQGLQDQLVSAKKAWQQQIWELRGQIRGLVSELEDLRAADKQEYCEVCGRGEPRKRLVSPLDERKVGIVNRPRARTGDTARFASGN